MKLNIEVPQRTPLRVIARRRAGIRRRIRVLSLLGWEHMSDMDDRLRADNRLRLDCREGFRRVLGIRLALQQSADHNELMGPARASFIESHVDSARAYWTKAKGV